MKTLHFFLFIALASPVFAQLNIPQPTREIVWNTVDYNIPLSQDEENFYYYDDNQNLVQIKTNRWDGNEWRLHSRTFNILDNSGNIVESLIQNWDTLTQTLVNAVIILRNYDAEGNLLSYERSWWNTQLGTWIYYYSEEHVYNTDNLLIQKTATFHTSSTGPTREKYT